MSHPSCPACGSVNTRFFAQASDVEYFSVPEKFNYRQCEECDSLSIDPIPRERLNQIYPTNYYSFSNQKQGFLIRVKTFLDSRLFKAILADKRDQKINVLDIGGGEGWMIDALTSTGQLVGAKQIVDISDRAGELARQKSYDYFCGRIEEFETPAKFYLILMLNLIEHVESPSELLKKAKSLLARDGILLIKTPNFESLDARIFKNLSWGGYHCPRHWVLFSMSSLEKLTHSLGFKAVSKKYTQGSPFWTWSLLHLLHKNGLIHLSAERPTAQHPLNPLLSLLFAAFDFIRLPFFKTSQMYFVLKSN